MTSISPQDVLDFWFVECESEQWFEKDFAFDKTIRNRFSPAIAAAREGRLQKWADTPNSCLALIILIDQFSRNVFRDSPLAWSADGRGLALAKLAIEQGHDKGLDTDARKFLYMPLMHSEDLADQEQCVALFAALKKEDREGAELSYEYAVRHRDVIARFGRFPHRNEVLGRPSAEEEIAFLKEPDSSF